MFQGHTSYVNTAVYMLDGAKVVTGSADGTVKVTFFSCVFRQLIAEGVRTTGVAILVYWLLRPVTVSVVMLMANIQPS